MFNKLRKNKRGMSGIAIALVLGLVTVAIVMPIGVWVLSITHGLFTGSSKLAGTANTTAEAVFANALSGFNLGAILPIIFAAGAIIAAIVGFMAFRKGGGGF